MPKGQSKGKGASGGKGKAVVKKVEGPGVSQPCLSGMTPERFNLWTDHALKIFLQLRHKDVEGSHQELTARAFSAWEENPEFYSKTEHEERCALQEYRAKLSPSKGNILPDPFSLEDGWLDEGQGMTKWPSVFFEDLAKYLQMKTPVELQQHLLNEYKVGKAYRYYVSGWVRDVLIHPVADNSPWCYMYARVCPSMQSRIKDYQVWALVSKDDGDKPGGQIFSAYCTCTAGLLGTCNHVAGLLFRIEAAVRAGLTNRSCTAKPCTWNLPKQRSDALCTPTKASSVTWTKGHYMNQDKPPTSTGERAKFSPFSKTGEEMTKEKEELRQQLADLLRPSKPDSCFQQLMDKRGFQAAERTESNIKVDCLKDLAQELVGLPIPEAVDRLCTHSYSEADRAAIECATRAQSDCTDWFDYRAGMVTASKVKNVVTKMATLDKSPDADTSALVSNIMGYNKPAYTTAIKYGRAQEQHAKQLLGKILKKRHRGYSQKDSGLVVSESDIFVGASPDLLVSCCCHGKGVCEIKCPYNIRTEKPSSENLDYLDKCPTTGLCRLKKNHLHYYQIQNQLAVCGYSYAYFFVYTAHGYHLETIHFSDAMWMDCLEKIRKFWRQCVAPELLTQSIWNSQQCSALDTRDTQDTSVGDCQDHCYVKQPMVARTVKGSYKPLPTKNLPVYLCGKCGADALVDVIQCNLCKVWYHHGCAGVTSARANGPSGLWSCDKCSGC